MEVSVNLLAVLGATIVSMIIGSLWYSKFLFGKPWMAAMNVSPADSEKMRTEAPKAMGGMFAASLVMSYVVAHFVSLLNISDLTAALQFAFWTWLGLIVTVQLSQTLFERRPFMLLVISTGYYLVQLVVMTLIFMRWQ